MCDCEGRQERRRGGGLISTVFQIALLYVALVFGGGTLIQTGHPIATDVGELIHAVTFVDPSIGWAERNDHHMIGHGLETLAGGVDVARLIS